MQTQKLIGRGLLATTCCKPLSLGVLKVYKLCGLPSEASLRGFQDKYVYWNFCIRLSTSLNIHLWRLAIAGNIGPQWHTVQGIWNLVASPCW
jgi:hypothetical protein